jgi:hypothetical protein
MLSSLVKYKDLALKVIYYTKRRQLGSKIFFATSKFQEVLLYFEKNLKDPQTFLKSSYFLNGKQIFPNDILLYFCTVDPNLRLVEEDLFIEIEELEHIDDSSEPIFSKLLKPLINPFKLIMLNVKEGILQMVDFDKDKIKNFGFDCLVNNNYACCNSLDALYISFGKNLWIISNKNFALEKKEMPIAKEKHSMVYIVSNNTIFIAGGDNTDSFYYDINNKEFIPWGKMSGIQEKPALIQYGDFLYSFNSFNPSGIYFERTKLTSPAKKWEKLIPQSGDQESGFFYNKLFGVSKCSGGNILFAGGINNQLRTFVYNLKLNVLYININKDESILLSERTFYKIDHNFNIGITQNIEKNHIIAIINKNSKSLYLLPFEQIGNKTRNNLLQYDNPRNRLPGNLVIQCRYMSIKDYENFLKQKEAQKKGKLNAPNNKNEIKKIGEKDVNEPFKFQFRNKTPLALERISEGKSDEENDDDEYRNKSSSAKKEKRKLELGVDSIEKFNLMMKKKENDKNKEKSEEKNNNNEKDKNCHSDLEPEERFNQDNTNTEAKQKINITDNNNNEQNKEKDETKKKLGLSDNNQISKSHKIIGNIKEEKVINKSKQSSKRSINSANNNTNDNKANKKDSTIKKSLNININTNNNNMKKIDINDKKENSKEIRENSNKINNNQKINNQQNISARTTTNNNFNNKDNVNNTNQQNNKIVNINSKTSNTTEQKKIVNIEKYNNNNTQVHIINQNKKSSSSNIASSNANQQKNQQNNSNPFVDTNKYNNISEKESTHLKNKSEQLLKKVDNSKTMNMTQQKKHNILKPPSTNTEDSRIQTDPNVSNNTQANNIKISSYKSSTHRQSQNEQKNIMYNNNTDNTNSNSQKLKKTNSFQVRININQDPKGRQETQKVKINTNANKTQSGNTNNNYNNTNVVISNNNGIRITKSTNQQNINVSNNNEANKDGKRYVLTKNVQRIRKDNDGQKKV